MQTQRKGVMQNIAIHAMVAASLATLLFSALAFGHDPVCGDGLVLVYESDEKDPASHRGDTIRVSFHLGSKLTMVKRPGGIDVVDYEGLRLYRYNLSSKRCETYRLAADIPGAGKSEAEDPDSAVIREKARLMGSCRVQAVDRPEGDSGVGPAVWKSLAWGGETDRFRTAGAVSVEMYGQLFVPLTEEYLVSTAVERVDDFFCLGVEREPVFQANPLLRRLDIGGLSGLLRGVALEFVQQGGHSLKLKEIGAAGTLSLEQVLPPACR